MLIVIAIIAIIAEAEDKVIDIIDIIEFEILAKITKSRRIILKKESVLISVPFIGRRATTKLTTVSIRGSRRYI